MANSRYTARTSRALHTTDYFPLPVLSYFVGQHGFEHGQLLRVALVHGRELLLRAARARVEHLVVARRAIGGFVGVLLALRGTSRVDGGLLEADARERSSRCQHSGRAGGSEGQAAEQMATRLVRLVGRDH